MIETNKDLDKLIKAAIKWRLMSRTKAMHARMAGYEVDLYNAIAPFVVTDEKEASR